MELEINDQRLFISSSICGVLVRYWGSGNDFPPGFITMNDVISEETMRIILEDQGFGKIYDYPEGDLFEFYRDICEFDLAERVINGDEYLQKVGRLVDLIGFEKKIGEK